MRTASWLLAALALPSPAWATAGLCEDLRLAIQSAHDTPAFSSMTRTSPPPDLVLFRHCRINQHDFTNELICGWRLPSPAPAVEDLAVEALRCLPGARRLDDAGTASRGEALLVFDFLAVAIARERGASGSSARITLSILEG